MKPFFLQCLVSVAVGLNIINFGCFVGYPAILLPQLHDNDSYIPITKEAETWIPSVLSLCALVGSPVGAFLMERFGRRTAHWILSLLSIAGWFFIILATNVQMIIVGRTLHGLSSGMLNLVRSILIGECTSPKHRGAFLSTVSLAQGFGVLFVHLVGSLLSWQITALFCVFFPFISLLMIMFLPESPSWLLANGKEEECRRVFLLLRGDNDREELEKMIKANRSINNTQLQQNEKSKIKRLFNVIQRNEFYKPIFLVFLSILMMHLSGVTTMANYSTIIISGVMGPDANAQFWMVFFDVQRVVSNVGAVFLIYRIKRRTVFLSTAGLCIVSQLGIAGYSYWTNTRGIYSFLYIPIILINMQMFSAAVGIIPMMGIICGEVLPLAYRGLGGMISSLSGSMVAFIVLQIFPTLLERTGIHGTYGLYSLILLVSSILVWRYLPETKGKTLQDIEDEFRGQKSHENLEESKFLDRRK